MLPQKRINYCAKEIQNSAVEEGKTENEAKY